jgi:hypothetical protein
MRPCGKGEGALGTRLLGSCMLHRRGSSLESWRVCVRDREKALGIWVLISQWHTVPNN